MHNRKCEKFLSDECSEDRCEYHETYWLYDKNNDPITRMWKCTLKLDGKFENRINKTGE